MPESTQETADARSETQSRIRAAGLERAEGAVRLAIKRGADGVSRLETLRMSGAAKCFLPRAREAAPLAVLVNTAGGLAGGDAFTLDAAARPGAALSITTQAAERAYRALDATPARVTNRIMIDAGARLHWLPQETILFDGGRLLRRLEVEMADDARLLAIETTTLGRAAMGETVREGALSDQWRIRRGGRLVFAEALQLEEPIDARLAAPAADGARAFALAVMVAPEAESLLEPTRALLGRILAGAKGLDAGASAWDGLLCIRIVGADASALRRAAAAVIAHLRGAPPPRFWSL